MRRDGRAAAIGGLTDKAVGESAFSETAVGTRTPVSAQRELCQQ